MPRDIFFRFAQAHADSGECVYSHGDVSLVKDGQVTATQQGGCACFKVADLREADSIQLSLSGRLHGEWPVSDLLHYDAPSMMLVVR